jgi:hypothetical protein
VRPRVEVDALEHLDIGALPARHLDDVGLVEEGCGGGGGELRAELAEREVLAALLDEGERGHVPERCRAAVAEQHLVAVGDREEVGEAGAHASYELLHGRLPVGGTEEVGMRLEVGQLLGTHLRGPASEAAVDGQQRTGDLERRHAPILRAAES